MGEQPLDTERPNVSEGDLGGPKLRTLMSAMIVALSGIAIGIAITLFVLPRQMNQAATSMASSSVSVRNAEAIEDALLEHYRTRSSVSRAAHGSTVQQYLAQKEASTLIESQAERELLREFFDNIRRYFALAEQVHRQNQPLAGSSPELDAALESTYLPLQSYIQLNNAQSQEARDFSRASVSRARVIGGVGAAIMLLMVIVSLFWIHRYSLQPVYRLQRAIAKFRSGDFSARAPVEGTREFRAIAARFNRMATMLEHRRKMQLAFLAGIAHDLRNPLAVVRLSAQAMTRSATELPPEDSVRKAFETIERQTTLIDRMVNDFLDAAAIEAGSLTIESERCDAVRLARDVCELFEESSKAHQLEFDAAQESVEINCDATRIKQVLINLVSNALKYSPRGGRVAISVDEEDDHVLVAVSDEGVGIEAHDLHKIFEPFHRIDASHSSIPGAGLGLAVVKRIVEAHDGTIDVESSPGHGSTFRVRLPRALSASASGVQNDSRSK